MIEKIEVRNFGNLVKRDIEFAPGVTSIIGSSYAGKSTLIRALKWVVLNKPASDQFINWEADKASVRLSVDDSRIIRKRGKGENIYRYNKADYTAFGNDVPDSIGKLLNISDINFQGQHAAPFWFCETAGEVSRQLNAIINLNVIDTTLSNIASELRKSRMTVEVVQERLNKVVEKKKELAYIEDLNRDFSMVESWQTQLDENAAERSQLADLLEVRAKHCNVQENALELVSDGLIAVSAGQSYQEIASRTEDLLKVVEDAEELQEIIEVRPPSLKPLEKLKIGLEKILDSYNGLLVVVEIAEEEKELKCQAERELQVCKKEFEKAVGKTCPLCGQPMPKKM